MEKPAWILSHESSVRKGYAPESVAAAIESGFNHLGLHSISASCLSENTRSAWVMEKCGMVKEGEFRRLLFRDAEWKDRLHYFILRYDWVGD